MLKWNKPFLLTLFIHPLTFLEAAPLILKDCPTNPQTNIAGELKLTSLEANGHHMDIAREGERWEYRPFPSTQKPQFWDYQIDHSLEGGTYYLRTDHKIADNKQTFTFHPTSSKDGKYPQIEIEFDYIIEEQIIELANRRQISDRLTGFNTNIKISAWRTQTQNSLFKRDKSLSVSVSDFKYKKASNSTEYVADILVNRQIGRGNRKPLMKAQVKFRTGNDWYNTRFEPRETRPTTQEPDPEP